MPVTIRDIAKNLSVSPATVSRSLRNDRLINSRTKAKVIKRAIEMGYHGSSRPQKDANPEGLSISVLIPETFTLFSLSSNYRLILEGISFEADASQANLSVHSIKWSDRGKLARNKSIKETINPQSSDAVILFGRHDPADVEFIEQFVPLVTINREYDSMLKDSVNSDHSAGIDLLLEYLSRFGHKRFQWVSEDYDAVFFRERHACFIENCLHKNLEIHFGNQQGQVSFADEGDLLLQKLRASIDSGVTAFICPTDRVGLRVVNILESAGIDVPDDISITGFDNSGELSDSGKCLTGIDPEFVQLGRGAVRMVRQRVSTPAMPANKLYLPVQLVEGQTSAINKKFSS